ncbi:MAG: hypothetical protein KatS3mg109_0036 [Pirellulaceae bacterium]|nr:MAG: hypothetical protein KatS3mg109_0036 [Pirellulaceae bacterium]
MSFSEFKASAARWVSWQAWKKWWRDGRDARSEWVKAAKAAADYISFWLPYAVEVVQLIDRSLKKALPVDEPMTYSQRDRVLVKFLTEHGFSKADAEDISRQIVRNTVPDILLNVAVILLRNRIGAGAGVGETELRASVQVAYLLVKKGLVKFFE